MRRFIGVQLFRILLAVMGGIPFVIGVITLVIGGIALDITSLLIGAGLILASGPLLAAHELLSIFTDASQNTARCVELLEDIEAELRRQGIASSSARKRSRL